MSLKAKFSWVVIAVFTLGTLLLFNNCQAIEPIGTVDSPSGGGGGGGSGGGGTGGGTPLSPANQYFESTVRPLFVTYCSNCHTALPRDVIGGPQGPTTIFNYTNMKQRVQSGPNANDNYLLTKMRGGLSHGGGNHCINDVVGTVTPCREAKQWITMEFPLLADGLVGTISSVSPVGNVYGYALNGANRNQAISVVVYANGPVGVGQLVGTYQANLAGAGQLNGHFFSFELPQQYRNGAQHALYVYGETAVAANLLQGMPYTYTAYTMSAAGRTYYTGTLRPMLNACNGCHVLGYDLHYFDLVNPLPSVGGTALNNSLINKMAGMNHAGGNFCPGGKNNGPCAATQQWWRIEFEN